MEGSESLRKKSIDDELDEEISKKSIANKEEESRLIASDFLFTELSNRVINSLKPLLKNDIIVKAIKENRPIVNVEPPIVKLEEKKHEIKMPDIKIPKIEVPKTTINLKPNIKVKASDVKIPKIMEVRGFMDFAKLAMGVLKNKITINASKENPLPVQLVYDSKFYEAIGGGGGPRSVWIKKKGSTAQVDVATEDKQDDIIAGLGGNSSVGDGTATVVTAGTEVQLPDVDCKRVFIQALDDNAGTIVVGGATVVADQATRRGLALFGSQGEWFNVSNLNLLYIDSTSSGDKISYYYEN